MLRNFLRSKLHGVRVTEANLHYVGSLSIDAELMEMAGIAQNEVIHLANVTNGERLTTYAIAAPRGSRVIGANGAAAHKVRVGDTLIVFAFAMLTEKEMETHKPRLIFADAENNPFRLAEAERHADLADMGSEPANW